MIAESSSTVFVSGFSGFVGTSLVKELRSRGFDVVLVPTARVKKIPGNDFVLEDAFLSVLELAPENSIFIHLGALAHSNFDKASLSERHFSNVLLPQLMYRSCSNHLFKRFLFLSTSNALSYDGFSWQSGCSCLEDNGYFKWNAEQFLKLLGCNKSTELVFLRSSLIYGANAPGNFGKLIQLANKNLPLPLGAIHNKRSLVALDNLVDLIVTCIEHPKAANQTFLVSDDQDVSTTELLQMMTRAAGKKPWLIPVPMSWLQLAGKLTGKQTVIDRLCGNLQVDISHTKETLGWKPPITMEEGIKRCFQP